uniref:Zinc knuckle CX2CX4HX4C n=1 Tax=Tanacetum cinerariifolium TaxID=118510 RepID=A0A699J8Q0_TANCI|nr:hypothetical protein [Tanacetum cinerariifolium]GFA16981.1 hypothetical protein [Tanacetum cinerariifolium]
MFQFSTKEGMENVLNQGPWRISVPIVTYLKVGLNLISSKLGRLIMLDAHTSITCLNLYGVSSYAKALVEISVNNDFVESLVMFVPLDKGKGHRMASIEIEFESRPPYCTLCRIFNYVDEECPKKGKEEIRNANMDSGPTENVKSKFIQDDINLGQLRSNMNKLMEEDKLLDINTNVAKLMIEEGMAKEKGNLWKRFKEAKEASTSKPRSSMSDIEDESDEDEVYMPDEFKTKIFSSTGGKLTMKDDDLECYDGYETLIYDVPVKMQKFCDQYDIWLNSHVRK